MDGLELPGSFPVITDLFGSSFAGQQVPGGSPPKRLDRTPPGDPNDRTGNRAGQLALAEANVRMADSADFVSQRHRDDTLAPELAQHGGSDGRGHGWFSRH